MNCWLCLRPVPTPVAAMPCACAGSMAHLHPECLRQLQRGYPAGCPNCRTRWRTSAAPRRPYLWAVVAAVNALAVACILTACHPLYLTMAVIVVDNVHEARSFADDGFTFAAWVCWYGATVLAYVTEHEYAGTVRHFLACACVAATAIAPSRRFDPHFCRFVYFLSVVFATVLSTVILNVLTTVLLGDFD